MLLAELNVRHTRRHMPTRRVALDDGYLPTSGSAFGGVLLGAVIAEHVPGLDEEQLDALHRLVDAARDGLTVPRIALRYRLQTDTHGLDLSRHRITGADVEAGHMSPILELDRHGPPAPQVIGALMAAAALPPSGRRIAFRFVEISLHGRSLACMLSLLRGSGLQPRSYPALFVFVAAPSPGTQLGHVRFRLAADTIRP